LALDATFAWKCRNYDHSGSIGVATARRYNQTIHLLPGRILMAKFVPLTLKSTSHKLTLYLNVDQVRYLRPQTTGGTSVFYSEDQSVIVEEDAATIASMAGP
jgi:hypothetical protein